MLERPDSIDPVSFALVAGACFTLALALATLRPAWVVRWPRSVLVLIALVDLGSAACLVRLEPPGLRLRIDPSTERLLPAHDPARELYGKAVRDFGADEVFVIAMESDDLFTHERLERLGRVTDRIAALEGVRRVQSLTDVISFRYVPEEDWVEVASFIEEIPADPAALARLRERALADPLYRKTIVSEDGGAAAINVSFREMSDREFIASGIDDAIGRILEEEAAPGVHFYVAGRPHVKARVYHLMLRDLRLLIPLALVAMALVLAVVFGSIRGVLLPLGTVLTALLWTFGAMAFLDRPLTVLTSLLAPTLIAIGAVYGVHVLARYEEEEGSEGPGSAARRSLEYLRLPVLIAGLTTCVGFAALLISDVPAVLELGGLSVFGVASITLISLTGLPAALALLPRPASAPPTGGTDDGSWHLSAHLQRLLDGWLLVLGGFVLRRSRPLLVAWLLLTVLAALAVPHIVIDTDYLSFFDEDAPVRTEFEAVNRLLAGAVPIYVVMRSNREGEFREPEVLRAVEALQERIDAIPAVSRSQSLVDTVRRLNQTFADDDPAEDRIPDSRAAVAELLFLAPKGHLDRFTNVNHASANLLVRTGSVGTAAVTTLSRRIEELLDDGSLPPDFEVGVTGNAILLARSADGIAQGQPRTVGLAVVTILVLISISLRSLRLGLVAMVPNVVPVLFFFGLLGLGVAPLSLPTSLIGSVALGLAIDDTAHLLVRYREERSGAGSRRSALLSSFRGVGRPVSITSLILIVGFLVVSLSGFATLRQFGLLSALTVGIALASDLLLLPALLARTRV